jgi:prefoldin alpha subunit
VSPCQYWKLSGRAKEFSRVKKMENESRVNVTEELNYLRSLIESIDGQVNTLIRGLEELRKAHLALTDTNLAVSKETRVAIGAGIFMEATLKLDGKLLVPIGSDIFIHEDPAAARTRLEENMKEVETSISGLNSQRDEISRRYDTILAAAQSQSGENRDVRRNQK